MARERAFPRVPVAATELKTESRDLLGLRDDGVDRLV
jgi:hypothetical protein